MRNKNLTAITGMARTRAAGEADTGDCAIASIIQMPPYARASSSAAMRLPQSTRLCARLRGRTRRTGATSQLVTAIASRPGWADMCTRRWFIHARSSAAATRKKNRVSSRKKTMRMQVVLWAGVEEDRGKHAIEPDAMHRV